MQETHYYDGREPTKQILSQDAAAARLAELMSDSAVKEVRTRKIEVGEEFEFDGRTLRLTDAGWRRVDKRNPSRTHELTPVERRLVVGPVTAETPPASD